jgi:hypothetical protein
VDTGGIGPSELDVSAIGDRLALPDSARGGALVGSQATLADATVMA